MFRPRQQSLSEPIITTLLKPDKKKWVHGEVRRQQIFDEAIDIIGQRGYRGFTLQELAQRCGLSNAGLLHHFPSKDQLLIGLLYERDRRDYAALDEAGLNFREVVDLPIPFDDLFKALREVVVRDAQRPEIVRLYTVLRAESLDEDHPARDFFLARAKRAFDDLARMLESHVPDPRSTARQLIALHGGLEEQWLREERSFDLVAEWERGARILLPGRHSWPEPRFSPPWKGRAGGGSRASASIPNELRQGASSPLAPYTHS